MTCESCGEEMVIMEDHTEIRNYNGYDTPPYTDGYVLWGCNVCHNTEIEEC